MQGGEQGAGREAGGKRSGWDGGSATTAGLQAGPTGTAFAVTKACVRCGLQIFKLKPDMKVSEINLNSGGWALRRRGACNRALLTSNCNAHPARLASPAWPAYNPRCARCCRAPSFPAEWWEPGENSFMREPLVWETFSQVGRGAVAQGWRMHAVGRRLPARLQQVQGSLACSDAARLCPTLSLTCLHSLLPLPRPVAQMGVQSLVSFHLHMRLNGAYFGKMATVEQMDTETLKVGAVGSRGGVGG